MSDKLKLLAMPFSTNDFLQFEAWAKENKGKVLLRIPARQSVHRLTDEIHRPEILNASVDGILLSNHKRRREDTLKIVSRILGQRGKKLYAISNGLDPIFPYKPRRQRQRASD